MIAQLLLYRGALYSYNWSNGNTNANATSLCCGSYFVTVIDNVGCLDTMTVNVPCNPLIVNASVVNETFAGSNDAEIIVNVTGGTPAYNYSLDGGVTNQSSNTFNGLSAGVYVVTVTDANGCVTTYTAIVIVDPIVMLISHTLQISDGCTIYFRIILLSIIFLLGIWR